MNFQNEFERETQHLPVPDTEIATVITTARSRTRRRRVAVSTLAAGVLIVGTAVGIQQLSTSHHTDTDFAVPPTPAPEASSAIDPSVPPSTEASESGETAVSPDAPLFPNATPAVLVPSNVTWTVLPADSPEALSYRFDSTQQYALDLRGMSADGVTQVDLYEQVNGRWTPVAYNEPAGLTTLVSGDTVYGIGTAPATAGGPEGSFGTFDTSSNSWRLHDLPAEARPYNSDKVQTEMNAFVAPIDGGMIVSLTHRASFETSEVHERLGYPEIGPVVDGNSISTFNDCDQGELEKADSTSTAATATQEWLLDTTRKHCTETTFDPSEFGLTAADLGALQNSAAYRWSRWNPAWQSSVWKVTRDSMVPFDVPEDFRGPLLVGPGIVSGDGLSGAFTYRLANDGTLTRVFDDIATVENQINQLGSNAVADPKGSTVVSTEGEYILTATPGRPTQITELLSAITSPNTINPLLYNDPVGVTGQLTVTAGWLLYDPPGTSAPSAHAATDSGYTLSTENYFPMVIDNATGTPVQFDYTLSTESGKVELLRYPDAPSGTAADTNTSLTMTEPAPEHVATFDVDWRTVPSMNTTEQHVLFTTTDGVHVATHDIQAIAHSILTADEEFSISDVTLGDGRVVVTGDVVSETSSGQTPTGKRYILVGTPN